MLGEVSYLLRGLLRARRNKSRHPRGKVLAFIPLTDAAIGAAEELAADDQGNVFAGFTAKGKMAVRKLVKN